MEAKPQKPDNMNLKVKANLIDIDKVKEPPQALAYAFTRGTNTQLVTDLLGGSSVAGFSENLYVAAMATDGWGRLSGYDASAVRAFVLAPTPPA